MASSASSAVGWAGRGASPRSTAALPPAFLRAGGTPLAERQGVHSPLGSQPPPVSNPTAARP